MYEQNPSNPLLQILRSFEKQRDDLNAHIGGLGDVLMGGYIDQCRRSIREAADRVEHAEPPEMALAEPQCASSTSW